MVHLCSFIFTYEQHHFSAAGLDHRHQVLCSDLIYLAREVSLQRTVRLPFPRGAVQVQVQEQEDAWHMGAFWLELHAASLKLKKTCTHHLALGTMTASCDVTWGQRDRVVVMNEISR